MEKITWEEGLEMIETKEEEANKLIQQFANTINDKEQQYSVKKFKDYSNITTKLSKMLLYEEKGTEKNENYGQRNQKIDSRRERLEVHHKKKTEEYEQLRQRMEALQNVENVTTEISHELGLTITHKDDGTLVFEFQKDSNNLPKDRLEINLGKENQV